MAHRKLKQEAFELFKKGFFPQDAAASLKANVRTCQRWFKEFQADNVARSRSTKFPACLPLSTVFAEENKKINAKHDNDESFVGENWFQFASKLVSNHFFVHNEIREKIQKNLNQILEEPEINLRALHTLSLALTRHIEAERIATMLDNLNINVAAQRLNADGYVVMEPDELEI